MHGTQACVAQFLDELRQTIAVPQQAAIMAQTEVVLFPPLLFLAQLQMALADTAVRWGAQTVSVENGEGAFTGEISAQMLADFGCRYVLVGHSERRALYAEDNAVVAQKFSHVKRQGLSPVLCVGETSEQYERGETLDVIMQQLAAFLTVDEYGVSALADSVIAYEPVWAIGTGKTASAEQAQIVHSAIRAHVAAFDARLAAQLPLIYGGSVKVDNAQQLLAMPDIDGVLVGGASLTVASFIGIASCSKSF